MTRMAIRRHTELEAYKRAYAAAMRIFELTKTFPKEERYSLIDQMRRSSRSVCANIAEGWRKRRYPAAFVSKLNDGEAEAAETQTWLQFSVDCQTMDRAAAASLDTEFDEVIAMLVAMINHPNDWTIK